MCGIAGIANPHEPVQLVPMLACLRHRGPDEGGQYHDPDAPAHLGIQRLRIIDPAGGKQPMTNEDGTIWVVLNGAIYNAPELRATLIAKGHQFRSAHSDTEVLVHLYEEQGDDMVRALNGMFAFVLYDRHRRRLFGARDRLGIKPLYYTRCGGFAFASELKSLLTLPSVRRQLSLSAVFHFLSLNYVPGAQSIFEDIQRLPPGCQFSYGLDQEQLEVVRYWRPEFAPDPDRSLTEWVDRIRTTLAEAVRRQTLSDVPLGCALSGGIDSASLVGLLAQQGVAPLRTYTLGFAGSDEEAFSECALARTVAERWSTEHHEVILTAETLLKDLRQMVWHLDEPYGGGLPSWYVFQRMGLDVRVALTGTGGDELFGNYGRSYLLDMHPFVRFARFARRGKTLHATSPRDLFRQCFFDPMHVFSDDVKRAAVCEAWSATLPGTAEVFYDIYAAANASHARDRVAYLDYSTQLPDEFLLMTDRFSMAHAVEARVPFLDHELVELLGRVPAAIRTQRRQVKYLLKQSVQDLLPETVLQAPKHGFVLPMGQWLRSGLREMTQELLEPARLRRQGLLRPSFFTQFVTPHLEGRADYTHQVWTALMFQLWHQRFIEEAMSEAPLFAGPAGSRTEVSAHAS